MTNVEKEEGGGGGGGLRLQDITIIGKMQYNFITQVQWCLLNYNNDSDNSEDDNNNQSVLFILCNRQFLRIETPREAEFR